MREKTDTKGQKDNLNQIKGLERVQQFAFNLKKMCAYKLGACK